MNRLVVILLCVCAAVLCSFAGYTGYRAAESDPADQPAPRLISCAELLTDVPANLSELRVTRFKSGKKYVSYDDDDDGTWDRVFVLLFPDNLKRLTHNYRAVIVSMQGIADERELLATLAEPALDAQYWSRSQRVDADTRNRIAAKYNSLDFKRSVLLRFGYEPIVGSGSVMLWSSLLGIVLSVAVGGWQALQLMLTGIRRESSATEEEPEAPITNRAELPTSRSE